jgi:hypothetical protein
MPGVSEDSWLADTRISYDTVADSYASEVRAALTAQPYLRAALALLADMVRAAGGGPVADAGCGRGMSPLSCTSWAPTPSASTCRPR